MKTVNCRCNSLAADIIGRITTSGVPLYKRSRYIYFGNNPGAFYKASISVDGEGQDDTIRIDSKDEESFRDGDIVKISSKGIVSFLWEESNSHNVLFLTESCSSNCVMCPQPPRLHDKVLDEDVRFVLKHSNNNCKGEICITGGEPTLLGDRFIEIIRETRAKHPESRIIVLTNGKSFANFDFCKKYAELGCNALNAVSWHSDIDTLHDDIAGVKGSFVLTHNGICNLFRCRQPIELRIVVSKKNVDRLPYMAEYIYRNYPFLNHVVLMALEMHGNASVNKNDVWVDPFDYQETLCYAAMDLYRKGINISIYNHPLCLLKEEIRPLARQSISAWKNNYIAACDSCKLKDQCCGFFTTSGDCYSSHILPVTN